MKKMRKINWRRWNNILHRDIGYLTVGITIIFAISGIAVNHVGDWNPNYDIERDTFVISQLLAAGTEDMVSETLQRLNISDPAQSYFRPSREILQIFLENRTIELNIITGQGTQEYVRARPVLHDMNYLHLNHAKKWWTYVSDLYAMALLFLAVSGLFVLRGQKGLTGRGKWLTGIGILIPAVFLLLYKYWT